jgi:hypothetical protein
MYKANGHFLKEQLLKILTEKFQVENSGEHLFVIEFDSTHSFTSRVSWDHWFFNHIIPERIKEHLTIEEVIELLRFNKAPQSHAAQVSDTTMMPKAKMLVPNTSTSQVLTSSSTCHFLNK